MLEDVTRVKKVLRSNDYNIWNSYFLILLSTSNTIKNYNIERNSIGLRKYVINEASDLYRIPFIKEESSESNELNFSKSLNEILSTDDPELKKIYDWMIKEDASYTDLGTKKIQDKVNEIMKEW
ncbi:ABC-three component system middle component 1 [Exiguobacterium indicum]|uniref:ABC-three component system middle component 1 n=1 Tax=Exiguobacterium indicum TaxID=296995 RepID=UPI003C6CA334